VGQVVDITTTTLLNSHYNQEMAIENLAYIKGLWENEALREVTLQPQEKVTGTIFFPRAILKGKSIHIHLPILSTEHTFLFRRD
jgi:hypothetical protein